MSDLISFGVAPAFLLYFWGLKSLGIWGLLLSFVFAAGGMLRLARFNLQAETDGGVSRYFRGLPAPGGGMGVATLVCLDVRILQRDELPESAVPGVIVATIVLALLMISNLPFRTFKDLRRTPKNVAFVGTVLVAIAIMSVRFDVLVALSAAFTGYFFSSLIAALLSRGWRQMNNGAVVLEEDLDASDDDEEVDHIDRRF